MFGLSGEYPRGLAISHLVLRTIVVIAMVSVVVPIEYLLPSSLTAIYSYFSFGSPLLFFFYVVLEHLYVRSLRTRNPAMNDERLGANLHRDLVYALVYFVFALAWPIFVLSLLYGFR